MPPTRSKLLSLPDKIASRCAHQSTEDIATEARALVHEALTELGVKGSVPPEG